MCRWNRYRHGDEFSCGGDDIDVIREEMCIDGGLSYGCKATLKRKFIVVVNGFVVEVVLLRLS